MRLTSPFAILAALVAIGLAYGVATLAGSLLAARGFPVPPADRRIGCIDGLRGYLAISVLSYHTIIWIRLIFYGIPWTAPPTPVFSQLGAGAVGLFFMITGLVFYPRVLKGWKRTNWVAVYITRLFRIMPMILVSVAAVSAISILRAPVVMIGLNTVAHLLKWLTTISEPPLFGYVNSAMVNGGVLWSLRYEWLFYLLILPACAMAADAAAKRVGTWVLPLAFLVLAGLARVAFHGHAWTQYLPLFFVGMLAYEIQARPRLRAIMRHRAIGLSATLGLVLAVALVATPYGAALPLFAYFFCTVACGNDLGGVLRTRGALVLGECSYGIYLVHAIFLSLLFTEGAWMVRLVDPDYLPLLIFPAAALVVTLCSAANYRLIERPMIALGQRLSRAWTHRGARVTALESEIAP